ncbi:phage head closure protein [Leclercia adecarboxylata]|jgi:SPP1 family predicted phage head-tail adaptor|uniref:phage head closure protein n=1 Tax=Leclercia adecarboxylata TaxID=83655 RepID=UPI0013DFDA65|nr:phage head closure protein [Leclercia adecarboxylata]MDU1654840.1 phage head closure protein [Leclercia adecarboxylata]MDU2019228.1 phage head closure protein [Leclercia adecarboxylata]QIG29398.1 head-tail adaptor protein [Leclercia adecarboxylata]
MKLRQAQTSATYLLPDPGELDKRVLLRKRVDVPAADLGTRPYYPESYPVWAKVVQTSATTYQETAQTDNAITHYITVRWRRGITSDFEVVQGEQVYRVRRGRDLNGKRRYLLLECTELGTEPATTGGNSNGNSLFSR